MNEPDVKTPKGAILIYLLAVAGVVAIYLYYMKKQDEMLREAFENLTSKRVPGAAPPSPNGNGAETMFPVTDSPPEVTSD